MARRRRKAVRRRNPVRRGRTHRARRTALSLNPRRRRRHHAATHRRRRHHFRRNPGMVSLSGIKGAAISVGMGLGATLAGVYAGNFITTNITPKIFAPQATDTAQSRAWKSLAVNGVLAVGVALYGKKVVPPIVAYGIAIGMVLLPARQVVYAMAPAGTSPTFLGGGVTAMPPFSPANRPLGLPRGRLNGMGSYPRPGSTPLGAYPQLGAYPGTGQSQPM